MVAPAKFGPDPSSGTRWSTPWPGLVLPSKKAKGATLFRFWRCKCCSMPKKKKSKEEKEAERVALEEEERRAAEDELRKQEEERIRREEADRKRKEELATARREELERFKEEVDDESPAIALEAQQRADAVREADEAAEWAKFTACKQSQCGRKEYCALDLTV